jgi:DNA-binding SARP family transcriptional activator
MEYAPLAAVTLQYRVIVVHAGEARFEAYVRAFPSLTVVAASAREAVNAARGEIERLVAECAREGRRPPPADREAVAIELVSVPYEPKSLYRPNVHVEITSGKVYRDGADVQLRGTALGLLISIATDSPDVSVDSLCDRLYPGISTDQAYSALKMCVYRARKQIGARGVIETTERGYRLADWAVVDIKFLPQIVRAIRSRSIAKAIENRLDAIFELLLKGRPAAFQSWAWFEPIERDLRASAREIGLYLADRALREGNGDRALERARAVAALDPLDESAQELEIRVHLTRGDRASALRAFRRYARDLQGQLGMEPSPALRDLIDRVSS